MLTYWMKQSQKSHVRMGSFSRPVFETGHPGFHKSPPSPAPLSALLPPLGHHRCDHGARGNASLSRRPGQCQSDQRLRQAGCISASVHPSLKPVFLMPLRCRHKRASCESPCARRPPCRSWCAGACARTHTHTHTRTHEPRRIDASV